MTLLLLVAQEGAVTSARVPNAMGAHTWFIVVSVGAFLAWAISYYLQLHKEALQRRKGREELIRRKEILLDQLIELEEQKENGTLTELKFKQELKSVKFRLAKVLDQINSSPPR
jgi:hypothetical protein